MITFPPLWIETLREVEKEIREESHNGFAETNWNPDAHVEITLTVRECRTLLAMLNVMETKNARAPKFKR